MGLDCDGQNTGASVGTQIVSGVNHTITAWVNPRKPGGTNNFSVVNFASVSPVSGPNLLIRQSDGAIGTFSSDANAHIYSTLLVPFNEWTFIGIRGFQNAITGTIDTWMNDGQWQNIRTGDTILMEVGNEEHMIGRWIGDTDVLPSRSAICTIADVRFYNRQLSEAEMQTIHSAKGIDGIVDGLSGRWQFPGGQLKKIRVVGAWMDGLSRGVNASGSNRLLVFFAAHTDTTTNVDLSTVTYGGETLTFIQRVEVFATAVNHIEMWVLGESEIVASSGTTFSVTWAPDATPSLPLYSSAIYSNAEQSVHVGVLETATVTGLASISTQSLLVASGEVAVAAASANSASAYTANDNFEIGSDATNGAHRLVSITQSGAASQTPSLTMAVAPTRQAMLSAVVRTFQPLRTLQTHRSQFISKTSATASVATSLVLPVCNSVIDGDLLMAVICPGGDSTGTPANVTAPTGWTLFTLVDLPATFSTPSLQLLRRTASSEPATYTFGINQNCSICGIMVDRKSVV